jgi:hypothetical protein
LAINVERTLAGGFHKGASGPRRRAAFKHEMPRDFAGLLE